jgi:PTH1 family peptidyl-tRNA hydrolase
MKNHPSLSGLSIIIALGNPGTEYAETYHNAGVQFIRFIKEHCFTLPSVRQAQDVPETVESLGTFMNVSGPAVHKRLKKNGITPDRLLLVHDDVDIPVGSFKFSFGSGAAGHHGVESVIASLGTKDFWRLRIGIAKTIETPDGTIIKKKAETYVLKPISQADNEQIRLAFEKATEQLQA